MRKLFHYIDQKLALWARRKYKTLRRRKQRSVRWLGKMMDLAPRLFVHWRIARREVG
jgi:RNA-directed DNA polymerase